MSLDAFFIVLKPGMVPRVGKPGTNLLDSVRDWHENSGGQVLVVHGLQELPDHPQVEFAETMLVTARLEEACETERCPTCGGHWDSADGCATKGCKGVKL